MFLLHLPSSFSVASSTLLPFVGVCQHRPFRWFHCFLFAARSRVVSPLDLQYSGVFSSRCLFQFFCSFHAFTSVFPSHSAGPSAALQRFPLSAIDALHQSHFLYSLRGLPRPLYSILFHAFAPTLYVAFAILLPFLGSHSAAPSRAVTTATLARCCPFC